MRIGGDHVGPRGAVLLAVTAAAGMVLAMHGWSVRHHLVPSLAAPRSSARPRRGRAVPPHQRRAGARSGAGPPVTVTITVAVGRP